MDQDKNNLYKSLFVPHKLEYLNTREEIEGNASIDSFQIISQIGEGKTSKVFAAKVKKYPSLIVAIKILKYERRVDEIINLLRVSHPNIVTLYDFFYHKEKLHLVMEYCKYGDLFDKVTDEDLSEKEVAGYFHQILLAIQSCHNSGIMHCDIKLENFGIFDSDIIKLLDFGVSQLIDTNNLIPVGCFGTLDYLAPEILFINTKYDYRIDIWSLGVLLYEMLFTVSPFEDDLIEITKNNIINCIFSYPEDNNISQDAKTLINKILQISPEKRPTINDILEDPWIVKNINQ